MFRPPPAFAVLLLVALGSRLSAEEPGASRLDAMATMAGRLSQLEPTELIEQNAVPPEAQSLLTGLKHELRDEVLARLDAAHRERRKPESVLPGLARDLHGRGITLGACGGAPQGNLFGGLPAAGDCSYGVIDHVVVERPRGHRDLLAVTTTLGIACGTDSSFYLLRDEPAGWRLLLSVESTGYAEISEALGSFGHVVSPPDARGGFFVAVVDINPWCTSNWQRIRLRLLRPGPDPEHPVQVLESEGSVWLGQGPPFYLLDANAADVSLAYRAQQSLDLDIHNREHIWTYAVGGRTAVRKAPVAREPQDFVDEWLALPWPEAARWSDPSRPDLERWHATVLPWLGEMYSEISGVRGRGRDRWDVEIAFEPYEQSGKPPPAPAQSLFFTVVRRRGAFIMEGVKSVPAEPDPAVTGR